MVAIKGSDDGTTYINDKDAWNTYKINSDHKFRMDKDGYYIIPLPISIINKLVIMTSGPKSGYEDLTTEELKIITEAPDSYYIEDIKPIASVLYYESFYTERENALLKRLMDGESVTEDEKMAVTVDIPWGQTIKEYNFMPGLLKSKKHLKIRKEREESSYHMLNKLGLYYKLNKNFLKNVVIYGSAVVSYIMNDEIEIGDVDMAIYGLDAEAAKARIESLVTDLTEALDYSYIIRNEKTIIIGLVNHKPIQITFGYYTHFIDLLLISDLNCCKMCFAEDKFWMLGSAKNAILNGYNLVNDKIVTISDSYITARRIKYYDRGFNLRFLGIGDAQIQSSFVFNKIIGIEKVSRDLLLTKYPNKFEEFIILLDQYQKTGKYSSASIEDNSDSDKGQYIESGQFLCYVRQHRGEFLQLHYGEKLEYFFSKEKFLKLKEESMRHRDYTFLRRKIRYVPDHIEVYDVYAKDPGTGKHDNLLQLDTAST